MSGRRTGDSPTQRALRAVAWAVPAIIATCSASVQPAYRDVLATAFDSPFQTSADVEIYHSNTRGRVRVDSRSVLIRHGHRALVEVDGERADAQRITNDISLVQLEPGVHDIRLTPGPDGPHPDPPPMPRPGAAETSEALDAALQAATPGDTVAIRWGVYDDWRTEITVSGEPDLPITVEPDYPGAVTFRRNSRIHISGNSIVLKGFRFDHCDHSTVVHVTGDENRVTQCQFSQCGKPTTTFAHICEVDMGADRNRVDHCYFTGSKSMSLAQRVNTTGPVGKRNRFDGNIFRDVFRYWINGQENIQLGQNQRGDSGRQEPECLVEGNLFDHAWGDGEIISNKSSRNTYRRNLAAHCIHSAFTLRGGDHATFEENVMISNRSGLRVMGTRHTIRGNLILDSIDSGIILETGSAADDMQVATEGTVIERNTIVDCLGAGIRGHPTSEGRPHPPTGNTITGNVVVGTGRHLDTQHFVDTTVRGNVLWGPEATAIERTGEGATWADPGLEGAGVSTHAAGLTDAGAPQMGERAEFPDLPLPPIVAPELYMGHVIHEQAETLSLADERRDIMADLPEDCVIAWDYHPEEYTSRAEIAFGGYALSWGGVAGDGLPTGLIELRHEGSETVVANTADVVQYYQDFRRQGWLDTTRNTAPEPGEGLWYGFTLLKEGGRLILLLTNGTRLGGEPIPVLTYDEHDALPEDAGLSARQAGAGQWRGLTVWEREYAGNSPPPAPISVAARAFGGGRVAIRWDDARTSRAGHTYEVHRAGTPDFEPSEDTQLTAGIATPHFEDFRVAAETAYTYKVRALNRLGVVSEFASVPVTSGAAGPNYHLILAAPPSSVEPPMRLARDGFRDYLWAPTGSGRFMEAPPRAGQAEYRFAIAEAGTYAVWGLVIAPDKATDSFYLAVDPRPDGEYALWSLPTHLTWGWARAPGGFELEAGEHTIRVKPRESGSKLAALMVTDDMEFTPGGGE